MLPSIMLFDDEFFTRTFPFLFTNSMLNTLEDKRKYQKVKKEEEEEEKKKGGETIIMVLIFLIVSLCESSQ